MKNLFNGYNIVEDMGEAELQVTTLFDCSRLRDLPQLDLWQDTMDSVSVYIFRNLSKVLEENKLRIVPYSQNGYTRLYLVEEYICGFKKEPKESEYIICSDEFETDSKDLEAQYLCLVELLDFIKIKYTNSKNSEMNFKCNQYDCKNCNINSSCPERKLELIENDNDEDYPVLSVVFPDGWRVKPSVLYDSFKSEFSEDFE